VQFVRWTLRAFIGKCEQCGRTIRVPRKNIIDKGRPPWDLKEAVQCECGNYHNLIVDKHSPYSRPIHKPSTPKPTTTDRGAITCPRCGSTQLHAGQKGFGLGKAIAGSLLVGGAGLLGGFLGSKKVMITCLNCGKRWRAGKR
jgi:hypothetical protein